MFEEVISFKNRQSVSSISEFAHTSGEIPEYSFPLAV